MKTVKIEGVEITLTKAQENKLKKANKIVISKKKKLRFKDLLTFDICEKVLKELPTHIKCVEKDFKDKRDWFNYKIRTIVKAMNFVDNNYKEWTKDWNNPNEYYYIPYFDLYNDSFSYYRYHHWNAHSNVGFGWGFKSKEAMLHAVDKFLEDYRKAYKGE